MKRYYFATIWAILIISACSKKTASTVQTPPVNTNIGKDIITPPGQFRFIDAANMNLSVKPGDDFFEYANGAWLKSTPIPPSETRWGSFNILAEKNRMALKEICEEVAAKPGAIGSLSQKVGDFYASGMDSVAIEKAGINPLKPYLNRIQNLKDFKSLIAELNNMYVEGVSSAFGYSVRLDAKNSKLNVPHLSQGGLRLPDRDYYLKDDARSKNIRKAYENHAYNIFKLLGDSEEKAKANAGDVLRFETKLAEAQMSRVERRDPQKTYNKMTLAELEKACPLVDWAGLMKVTGTTFDYVIVDNPNFFKTINDLLKNERLDDWKTYLRWAVIKDALPYLNNAFVTEGFKMSKVLTGQKEMQPRWKRVSSMTDGTLGEALGQIYVERYFKPEAKQRMLTLLDHLLKTYEKRIKGLEWMSETTKQKALIKLSTFVRKIGYPDKWRDYSKLTIDRNKSYLENVMAAGRFARAEIYAESGKPVDPTRWGMTPPTVNAYYSPVRNEIVFPAGILQFPFFDNSADDAINYGGIGAVIGHEISHGFDDSGRQYDQDGNLTDWWTAEDAARFKVKADAVVNQYNACIVLDTVRVNGKLTLGENIADLGGLSVAYEAFKTFSPHAQNKDRIDGFTPDQRFFLSWAQVWRSVIREEALAQQIQTDPHSPGRFRCNIPLSNMTEFYNIFGVKQGDKLWRPENERIKIW
jgi:putative endopeptidase